MNLPFSSRFPVQFLPEYDCNVSYIFRYWLCDMKAILESVYHSSFVQSLCCLRLLGIVGREKASRILYHITVLCFKIMLCCSVPEQQLLDIEDCDLNVVRLCFQVFLPDEHGNLTTALPPVVSNPIYDNRKCFNFLMSVLLACCISLIVKNFLSIFLIIKGVC